MFSLQTNVIEEFPVTDLLVACFSDVPIRTEAGEVSPSAVETEWQYFDDDVREVLKKSFFKNFLKL